MLIKFPVSFVPTLRLPKQLSLFRVRCDFGFLELIKYGLYQELQFILTCRVQDNLISWNEFSGNPVKKKKGFCLLIQYLVLGVPKYN